MLTAHFLVLVKKREQETIKVDYVPSVHVERNGKSLYFTLCVRVAAVLPDG